MIKHRQEISPELKVHFKVGHYRITDFKTFQWKQLLTILHKKPAP